MPQNPSEGKTTQPVPPAPPSSLSDRDEARSIVTSLDHVVLPRYYIVGSYARYDEGVRNALLDARQKIVAGLGRGLRKRNNHLIWAAPGSGKTYFMHEVADALAGQVHYREINLAQTGEAEFSEALREVTAEQGPLLCLIDEADAKPHEPWPYELLLPCLDEGVERGDQHVFVLAGSSGASRQEMKAMMAARPKGVDLLSRVPTTNEFDISPMGVGDRVLIVLTQLAGAAREVGIEIKAVEKLALLYAALSPDLTNARQLREFAVRAIERVLVGDDRVKYDHLFGPGDPENKRFYADLGGVAGDFVSRFVTLEANPPPGRPLGEATRPSGNLPIPLTQLLGRDRELAQIAELYGDRARLVTLTGPPGVGKTRLGLEVTAHLQRQFRDGVFWIDLAPTVDPALVEAVIAQALGIKPVGSRPLLELIKSDLGGREVLLALDNFEHLGAAAPLVADLLGSCPGLKVLCTSRRPLRLRGESLFPVSPLAVPDVAGRPSPEELGRNASVALFVQRSCAVKPEFSLTAANAPAVAGICVRLEGLPLAIELAAARIRSLPPAALLERLARRLPLLTGGPQDVPARQRALREALAWSYSLLEPVAQRLLRRLSVFMGGAPLAAVEQMCTALGDTQDEVLDGLAALVDNSLLRQEDRGDAEPRFLMLETVREFAREQLASSDEEAAVRERHARYFLAMVEASGPVLLQDSAVARAPASDPAAVSRRGRPTPAAEQDNTRAALRWLVEFG